MNKARKMLARAAQRLDLPADVVAGLPTMELAGTDEFGLEPHCGLLEYSKERVMIMTAIGVVTVQGSNLIIRQMNGSRIVVSGHIKQLLLPEA